MEFFEVAVLFYSVILIFGIVHDLVCLALLFNSAGVNFPANLYYGHKA